MGLAMMVDYSALQNNRESLALSKNCCARAQ